FWAGTFGLAVFGFIELIYFCWIFGMDDAWDEMHHGHNMKIPRIFYYIMKYITPLYIFVLIVAWGYQDGIGILKMAGQPEQNIGPLWGARIMMAAILMIFIVLIKIAWDRKRKVSA
ncbi:MAG TPA: sodium:calcium symporter, partial [Candidatus Wallbacteria bacterium]|nr:sodium:calcium symporter [Candidatus Wallbacteria bacterium]